MSANAHVVTESTNVFMALQRARESATRREEIVVTPTNWRAVVWSEGRSRE